MPNIPWYNSQITPKAAVEIALQRVPGRVIDVELDTKSDCSLVYEIEIRANSGVFEVKVDAVTGEILRAEPD